MVLTNESLDLIDKEIDVGLRIGNLPDSSLVAESSGYPALDSAALAGARNFRFSPALHRGRPVALSFLQPVLFRAPRPRGTTP